MRRKLTFKPDPNKPFVHNRRDNSNLHVLYMQWAFKHMVMILEFIDKLSDQSNINLHEIIYANYAAVDFLIKENAAYADAWPMVQTVFRSKEIKRHMDNMVFSELLRDPAEDDFECNFESDEPEPEADLDTTRGDEELP